MSSNKHSFTFIDLFAGIGGTRTAFEKTGGRCVFTSEWDKHSQLTYFANFGELPHGDIKAIDENNIPDHDVLLAGFPCQPFSIAGVSKNKSLGRKHGFEHRKQGNLFFDIARILLAKKPKAILLENVKNLQSHDKGNTFKVICEILNKLGYKLFIEIKDAKQYVPQHRERIFIVGFRKDIYPDINFQFPKIPTKTKKIADILEENVDKKYTLSDILWKYLQNYAAKHKAKGNGFGFGLIDPEKDTITRTLSARYYKDGSEILIKQKGKNPRKLTPRECARLMGFDDSFKIIVSDTQAYKQFGNSLCVPLVEAIAKQMIKTMDSVKVRSINGQTDNKTQELEYVQNQIEKYKTGVDIEEISPQIRIPL
ncbi:MAG: DNA (cytosine-5-)-methyltransferase [bacterium]|nr:DNA (cytosine-5-)-methyltransferase [Patescibacteria group bacterium]